MERVRVIARAFEGEPLDRVAVGGSKGAVFLSHPNRLSDVERGDSVPVAFQDWNVFRYDEAIYRELRGEWEAKSATSSEAWKKLEPARVAFAQGR